MKLNPLPLITRSLRQRSTQAMLLGGLAVAVQVACSDNPTPSGGTFPTNTSGSSSGGSSSNSAGTGTTSAGTAAGTFTTGGTFTSAGSDAGGSTSAGTATGGSTSAGTNAGGTGGTPPVPVPYCMGKTPSPLPFTVNDGFQPSGWGPDAAGIAEVTTGDQITTPPADACKARVANAVGTCSMWRWTPAATPTYSFVSWITMWDAKFTHAPVCLPEGAKAVTFAAKGVKGGELISVSAGGANEVPVTLTTDWKEYSIPLDGVTYNTFDAGVTAGFSWKVDPGAAPAVTEFFLDDIKFVKDAPAAGGGGSGGGGGTGGAGGSGGGGTGGTQ